MASHRVRMPVGDLCNYNRDFDQTVEVRLRLLALPPVVGMFAGSEVGRPHERDDVIRSNRTS